MATPDDLVADPARWTTVALLGSLGAAVALWVFTPAGIGLSWVLGASAVAFALFGLDKRRATRGRKRVPDATLLMLAVAGGAVGGWAARSLFRHKARKFTYTIALTLGAMLSLTVVFA